MSDDEFGTTFPLHLDTYISGVQSQGIFHDSSAGPSAFQFDPLSVERINLNNDSFATAMEVP